MYTKSVSDSEDDESDSSLSNFDTTTLGGFSTTASLVGMSTVSISEDNDTSSLYTGYSTGGSFKTSINSGASSGGARLPAGTNDDESGWQSAPGTRVRRGVASSTGANTSGVSTASTTTTAGTIIESSNARMFDKNAYGKPKAPAAVTVPASSFTFKSSRVASSGNSKFAKVKAFKPEDDVQKAKQAFESMTLASESRILDPDWDSDVSSSQPESDFEDDDDDTE
jgi:hypothetical protein